MNILQKMLWERARPIRLSALDREIAEEVRMLLQVDTNPFAYWCLNRLNTLREKGSFQNSRGVSVHLPADVTKGRIKVMIDQIFSEIVKEMWNLEKPLI